jgi:hypothetical protein
MAETKATSKTAAKAARTSKTKKRSASKKLEPAVRYLRYNLTNSATAQTETSHFIDLAKDLSALNRRLYRQGRCYHVKRVSIVSSNTISQGQPAVAAGRVTFSTVPTSWVAHAAWKRGFEAWRKMQAQVLDATGTDVTPTWNDFKVYMSNDMRTGTILTPIDNGSNLVKQDDWSYSFYQSPDGTTGADDMAVMMLGGHVGSPGTRTAIGLVQSYGDARATVNSNSPTVPNTLDDDPIANLFDHGTVVDEVAADMRSKGEDPPYDFDEYPGSGTNVPKPLVVQQTTLGADGRSSVGGFDALCGLIEVEITSPYPNDIYSVLVELAPGNYRGIGASVI